MSKSFLWTIFLSLISLSLTAKLQVQLSYSTFYSPSLGPYIEVYLYFNGNSLKYIKKGEFMVGEIQASYEFFKEGQPIKSTSSIIESPSISTVSGPAPNFINQHRIPLENGSYEMKIRLKDMNSDEVELETVQQITINYSGDLLLLSDIEIILSAEMSEEDGMFQKSGYKIIPYTSEIIPAEINNIGFYAELYNAQKFIGEDSSFLITYYLKDYETGELVTNFKGFSRKKASEVNVIIGKFLLSNLAGGNYYVQIDVLNRNNQLLASKSIAFHKVNPPVKTDETNKFTDRYTNLDSLAQHIDYLQPISDRLDWEFAQNQLDGRNFELMKKFFFNFWSKRDASNPEGAWMAYLQQVQIVNKNFTTTLRPGYLSDRGFRYLKYGSPNDRYQSFDEPNSYPYEVWYYNQVNNQTNKMIVFYNPSLVLNDFIILHSDILGEVKNKDWNLILHRMNSGYYEGEEPSIRDEFGDRTKDHLQQRH